MLGMSHRTACSAVLVAGVCVCGTAVASNDASGAALGAWKDYALRSMTPDFGWAEKPSEQSVTPTALSTGLSSRTGTMPRFDFAAVDAKSGLGLSVSRSVAGDTPVLESGGLAMSDVGRVGVGLERTFVAPSLTHEFLGGSTAITAAAVLVYQEFASWGFGSGLAAESAPGPVLNATSESSAGSGVKIELRQQLNPVLGFTVAYQSKVDMDAFQNYRGVFSDPGDFDVPALASIGLGWQIAPNTVVGIGASRVMWSDVSAFTSNALPRRFLALLGDGTSPAFEWRDHTVFNFDIGWRPTLRDEFILRVTSQQQPEPTSTLLRQALEHSGAYSDTNLGFLFRHRFDRFGTLRLGASYAAAQYFLGNVSYADRDLNGDQVEVEAVWTMAF
jgi:hypothetical protein